MIIPNQPQCQTAVSAANQTPCIIQLHTNETSGKGLIPDTLLPK